MPATSPIAFETFAAMSLKTGHEKCIIPGCSASNKSLHSLPKERNLADKWMDFIFGEQTQPVQSQSFRVCTGHFTPECIQNQGLYDAGVVSKLLLKRGSIPTIWDPSQNIKTVSKNVLTMNINKVMNSFLLMLS